MKKVTFLLATLLIGGMMLTGCKKTPTPSTPDTPSTPTTRTVVYKMDNTYVDKTTSTTFVISPCFHFSFSYKDANGTMVTVNDPTLPWSKEITVTTPFEAKLEGTATYNEADLPEDRINYDALVYILGGGTQVPQEHYVRSFPTKEKFLEYMGNHPDLMSYSYTLSVN
jgi:hypothetical protein